MHKHQLALAIVACLLATSCGDGLLLAKAQEAVREQLKDPQAAQFQSLEIKTGLRGQRVVCGEVNAKNAMGGYVGFAPFVFVGTEVVMADPGDSTGATLSRDIVRAICDADPSIEGRLSPRANEWLSKLLSAPASG